MDAPYALLDPLEPGIARVLAHNPSAFTFTGTQTYLVGDVEVAVIDPGPDTTEHLTRLVKAIGGRPVAAIMCTHTHRDHSPAARPLADATGAPIIGCAPLALETVGPRADAAFDGDYRADRVLEDGEGIEVDGRRLIAVATPGHTSNHLCFADEASGALFTGDHVMGWSTTVVLPPDGDMAAYMAQPRQAAAARRPHLLSRARAADRPIQAAGPRLHRPPDAARTADPVAARSERARTIPEIVAAAYPGLDPRLTDRRRRIGLCASSGP